jgi:methylmalonyl-CoA/ethylmalonyl-CoA epimerase
MKHAVVQMAYVSRDLEASTEFWTGVIGAGPFFFSDVLAPTQQIYRGAPAAVRFKIAVGYSGDMQIEVVQPLDDSPSIFTEIMVPKNSTPVAGSFHHIQLAHQGYDAAYAGLLAAGATKCFDAVAPGVGRICFLDARRLMGCFVELVETTPTLLAARAKMHEIHQVWDGGHPRRQFADVMKLL